MLDLSEIVIGTVYNTAPVEVSEIFLARSALIVTHRYPHVQTSLKTEEAQQLLVYVLGITTDKLVYATERNPDKEAWHELHTVGFDAMLTYKKIKRLAYPRWYTNLVCRIHSPRFFSS